MKNLSKKNKFLIWQIGDIFNTSTLISLTFLRLHNKIPAKLTGSLAIILPGDL